MFMMHRSGARCLVSSATACLQNLPDADLRLTCSHVHRWQHASELISCRFFRAVSGNVKSAAGNVQQKAGELFGSDEQQAKGAARDASGQAKVCLAPHLAILAPHALPLCSIHEFQSWALAF